LLLQIEIPFKCNKAKNLEEEKDEESQEGSKRTQKKREGKAASKGQQKDVNKISTRKFPSRCDKKVQIAILRKIKEVIGEISATSPIISDLVIHGLASECELLKCILLFS